MRLLSSILIKRPVIISLVFIVVMLVMIAGVSKMKLATGNETLMSIDSKVYKDNQELEKYFGGESIILLSTSQQDNGILTVDNLRRMEELGTLLKQYDNIYSFVSPASIVGQLTSKQFEKMSGNLVDITSGLQDMSAKLMEIGKSMERNMPNSSSSELIGNLGELSDKVALIGIQLEKVEKAETFKNLEALRILKESRMMTNQLAEKMKAMTGDKSQASSVAQAGEISQLSEGLKTIGGKLLQVSDGLTTLSSFSDIAQPGLPRNPNTLNTLLYDQGKLRPIFDGLILDEKHSVIMIKLKGGTDDQEKSEIIDIVRGQMKKYPFDGTDTIITGKPIMDSAIHTSMQDSMKMMIGIAVVLMLIVLTIVFHVRWRVIAIPIILLSVFATLGLMGLVSVPMTMVSMAVFPILIGLGVDYAIQFQNRYEEEKLMLSKQGEEIADA